LFYFITFSICVLLNAHLCNWLPFLCSYFSVSLSTFFLSVFLSTSLLVFHNPLFYLLLSYPLTSLPFTLSFLFLLH
jgi:hypothetical protein